MVYTRSSSLVHELHSAYLSVHQDQSQNSRKTVRELAYPRVKALTVLKLSTSLSKRQLSDFLKDFFHAKDKELLIVSSNMQDTSAKAINHLRILIEEAEGHGRPETTKLVAILLLFPSSMFPHGCYPSLFLNGWDHHYLDGIAHNLVLRTIDTEQLFLRCCSPNLPSNDLEKSLLAALHRSLPEAAGMLASRSHFSFPRSSLNKITNTVHNREKFEEFLFSKGAGHILCCRFLSYLSPSVLTGYLQEATMLAQDRESTSSITNAIETMLKGHFFDFVAHIVFVFNCDHVFDIIFDAKCTPAVHELFMRLLDVMPLPEFAHLSLPLKRTQEFPVNRRNYKFPFYCLISQAIEDTLHTSIEGVNQMTSVSDEDGENLLSIVSLSGQELQIILEYRLRQDILVRFCLLKLLKVTILVECVLGDEATKVSICGSPR